MINQDPLAWAEITKEYVAVSDEPFENAIPLYTKREWVGLDAFELKELYEQDPHWLNYAANIEQALKEKNT